MRRVHYYAASVTTRLYTSDLFLGHRPGPSHPERPERLESIHAVLQRAPVANVTQVAPRPATRAELTRVHTAQYVERVLQSAGTPCELDPDTSTSAGSVEAALLAAGATVQAVQDVLSGAAENGFALVRPPGHHAEEHTAMGFCLFNNAAVAAEAALARGAQRVLLLDWDVHHGNGSQSHFWKRRDVLYASVHQHPFYPGTGAPHLAGEGDGAGFNVNCGLPGAQGDDDYAAVFEGLFLPIAEQYRPDLVVVSAGFDPHRSDPLGGMRVTERGFAAMCSALKVAAKGRIVLALEGGYDLDGLAQSVHACVEVLAGGRSEAFTSGTTRPDTAEALEDSWAAHSKYWRRVKA
ncbi:MAG: histone deacetylase [Archangiaceae bacterium]|nr:histone deacetylase [Archangiaceae bacterium]